ncbi:putative holin [Motilimonas sp. 1_MG-2023]|uniref:putative holin n=1 Tax=Motilimonas sp. 1_MG-2023 TaxID=3062672 RepID=UPI0026E37826|nr:putative holin [Motilimonas sp. 1_MG-2023]MDO6525445.1 putative holin [Motilimonas sp. 1_MG-2023]
MSEPTAATVATLTTTGAAVAAPALGIDPMLVIGAITGAGIFVLSHEEESTLKKLILFIGSVACGFICAQFAADIMSAIIPGVAKISEGVGAVVASSISVRFLQRALQTIDSGSSLVDIIKGRKP